MFDQRKALFDMLDMVLPLSSTTGSITFAT
jgi:hypothetical protein